MNQRSSNRRRHAPMPFGQLVECRNGFRVAQHHSDLAPLLAQISLTLGAGLGLCHGSGRKLAHEVKAFAMRLPTGQLGSDEPAAVLAGGGDGENALLDGDSNQLARQVADFCSQFASFGNRIHVHLRGGQIPPMYESYTVTSDVSTLFDCAVQKSI